VPKLVVAGTGELRLKQKRGEASSVKSSFMIFELPFPIFSMLVFDMQITN